MQSRIMCMYLYKMYFWRKVKSTEIDGYQTWGQEKRDFLLPE